MVFPITGQNVSTYELLVQPIVPPSGPAPLPPPAIQNPLIVQAYFLVISNTSAIGSGTGNITLEFISNGNDFAQELTFTDRTGAINVPLSIDGYTAQANITVNPTDTQTFLLQPNLSKILPSPGTFESRGYVTVSANAGTKLLISPQIRGTFYTGTYPNLTVISEEAYSLPLAQSSSFYVF